jgi:hypothetical protein
MVGKFGCYAMDVNEPLFLTPPPALHRVSRERSTSKEASRRLGTGSDLYVLAMTDGWKGNAISVSGTE